MAPYDTYEYLFSIIFLGYQVNVVKVSLIPYKGRYGCLPLIGTLDQQEGIEVVVPECTIFPTCLPFPVLV